MAETSQNSLLLNVFGGKDRNSFLKNQLKEFFNYLISKGVYDVPLKSLTLFCRTFYVTASDLLKLIKEVAKEEGYELFFEDEKEKGGGNERL